MSGHGYRRQGLLVDAAYRGLPGNADTRSYLASFSGTTIGAAGSVASVGNRSLPFVALRASPPDFLLGVRGDILGGEFTVQGRMPLAG